MAWGDQFNNVFFLGAAEKAYYRLKPEEKQTVDAAIIKRLNREAYEAAVRIYEERKCKKPEILAEIFDGLVEEYLDADRVMILRGYMTSRKDLHLAYEELAFVGDHYQTVMLSEAEARRIASQEGVCKSAFNNARTQLMPMAPVISYILRALKPDYVESQLPERHREMLKETAH